MTTIETPNTIPAAPPSIRFPLLGVSAVGVLLFGWSLYVAAIATEAIVWPALGFSLIGIVSAVYGVLLGLGMYRAGFGLGALCVAGGFVTSGVLGWVDLRSNLASVPELARMLRPWLVGVGLIGVSIGGLAGLGVAIRSARSWAYLAGGAVCAVAFAGLLALFRFGPAESLLSRWEDGPEAVRVSLILVAAFAGLALLSAGTHLFIRGIEVTREPNTPDANAASA